MVYLATCTTVSREESVFVVGVIMIIASPWTLLEFKKPVDALLGPLFAYSDVLDNDETEMLQSVNT